MTRFFVTIGLMLVVFLALLGTTTGKANQDTETRYLAQSTFHSPGPTASSQSLYWPVFTDMLATHGIFISKILVLLVIVTMAVSNYIRFVLQKEDA